LHLKILACDLDGTLAEHGDVAVETWELLRQAKTAGLTIILVTGRILDTFTPTGPYAELCEAIVAEDGAVVYFPRRNRVVLPFGRLDSVLLERLEALDIPFQRGTAIRATQVPHDQPILEILQEVGGGATVEYNRGAVMVLPPGATKGTGLLYALRELGFSPRNVIACGDAENDRSLFEVAEVAVAVANAAPKIQAQADVILSKPDGTGVRSLVNELLDGMIPARRPRPDRQLHLGQDPEGMAIALDPFTLIEGNLGIVGASGSGKSWLAGLLVEELIKQGYQICVIDPEGDYRAFQSFERTLLLGGTESRLPAVSDVAALVDYAQMSLVLDFSTYSVADRNHYVQELLRSLAGLRAKNGRPHWFLIDEIQNFCPLEGGDLTELILQICQTGGIGFISFRPSQVAPALLEAFDHWILTRLDLSSEELGVINRFLAGSDQDETLQNQVPKLPQNRAYFQFGKGDNWSVVPEPGVVTFHAELREIPHIRHLHKYLRAPLPESKRFHFHEADGYTAANLWEFRQALSELPLDTLAYHLERGDFERWLREVLHDHELARWMRKIAHRKVGRNERLRQALVETVSKRYAELESLV
jgi:hydroxymethylpyrimidine pyrophosphatase-like HAD family hydrolase